MNIEIIELEIKMLDQRYDDIERARIENANALNRLEQERIRLDQEHRDTGERLTKLHALLNS